MSLRLFLAASVSSLCFMSANAAPAVPKKPNPMTLEQKWDLVKRFAAKIPVKRSCEFNYHVENVRIDDNAVFANICDDKGRCDDISYQKRLFTTGEAKIYISDDNEYNFSFDWQGSGSQDKILSEMIFDTHRRNGKVIPRVKLASYQRPNGYEKWISCDLN